MKRLWWLILAAVIPVRADVVTLDVQGEVQEQSQLCWAAVSVMAMRVFPSPTPARQPTQRDMVLYRGSAALPPACTAPNVCPDTAAVTSSDVCPPDLSYPCDVTGYPWLFDLDYRYISATHAGNTHMLSADTIRHEIGTKTRPVLIMWDYLDPGEMTPQQRARHQLPPEEEESEEAPRTGKHALIITGYDSDENKVLIWDPWPPKRPLSEEEESDEPVPTHEKWIPYDRYANPLNDEGSAVVALHDHDQFRLCRGCSAGDEEFFDDMDARVSEVPPLEAPELEDVDFIQGPPNTAVAINGFLSGHEVRDRNGEPIQGTVRADLAFPIIAISTKKLLGARGEPESLLQPRTSVLVVPVMRGRKVVDSFLLLHKKDGSWIEGGYSNNEIARRLVDLRARLTSRNRAATGFYLVSIPEQGTFYLGHGFQGAARLVSLSQGGKARMTGASRTLRALIGEIQVPAALRLRPVRPTPN